MIAYDPASGKVTMDLEEFRDLYDMCGVRRSYIRKPEQALLDEAEAILNEAYGE